MILHASTHDDKEVQEIIDALKKDMPPTCGISISEDGSCDFISAELFIKYFTLAGFYSASQNISIDIDRGVLVIGGFGTDLKAIKFRYVKSVKPPLEDKDDMSYSVTFNFPDTAKFDFPKDATC